jgi:predicted RNA-binding Zn-ribbon protein involved in translation (DUF1610 family)
MAVQMRHACKGVKVLAEAENNQTSSTQVASCPECGNQQVIRAEKIISITEEIDVAYPATGLIDRQWGWSISNTSLPPYVPKILCLTFGLPREAT